MDSVGHRRRSKVWLAFIPDGFGEEEKATCRICNKVFPSQEQEPIERCTTAKLWRHLNTEHTEVAKMLSGINQDDIIKDGTMDHWNLSVLQKQTSKGFTSKVWKFFGLDETDKNISVCFKCGSRISRGCDRNTTSMWNHIKHKHPTIYYSAHKEDEVDEDNSSPIADDKAAVKDQFLLYSARQNSYICKTCGTIMRLESPDEEVNTSRLNKHLDNIFHKRVQHGLEPPKRPILPKFIANSMKTEKKKQEVVVTGSRKLPVPYSAEKVATDREVDLFHSAVMMQTLFTQQKRDLCCDCTIVVPHKDKQKSPSFERYPVRGVEEGSIECYESRVGFEFKVHSCVVAVISNKMRALFDNSGSSTIVMHDISREAMAHFIEVAYLGKLKNLHSLGDSEVFDLYNAAQSFGSNMISRYLERECPCINDKYIADRANNPSFGKITFLFKSKQGDNINAESENSAETTEDTGNLQPKNGFDADHVDEPSVPKKSSSSRRKRPPLSTTFRLKVPKIADRCSDSEIEDYSGSNGQENSNGSLEGSPIETGMKFEIQGDTAILRASPDQIDDPPDEVDFTQ